MIPAGAYDPQLADQLRWWLIQQLRQTMSDRGPLEAQWLRWERIYRARPAQEKKDFPWPNASNLVVALAATDVDTSFARISGMLFEPKGLWTVEAMRPELQQSSQAMDDFLEWAQHNELDLYNPVGNWLLDIHKLGTGILKQRYTREMKKVYEWRELQQGTWQQQTVVMLKDHPDVGHVHIQDFYIPAGYPRIQEAPWVAERVRLNWQQFMNRVKAGIYMNAQQVSTSFFSPSINRVQQQLDVISNYRPAINSQMEFYEFWLDFDIDGDGWDEALVCTIHLESESYVRLDLNPFFNQDRPYSAANFMRDPNSFYGIGMCEMDDHYQEEMTALHNQTIDNNTVQNAQLFALDRSETSIKKNEKLWPGKMLRLANVKNLVPLNMGAGNGVSASLELQSSIRSESMRRTGINDWIQGQATPAVGYGTAYTTQQMQANSSMRFGELLRSIRDALSETGTRVLELYQQFNQRGKPVTALGPDGQLVNTILQFPLDLIRRGMRVSVTAIDVAASKDSQLRTQTLIYQTLTQFYQQYLQLLGYAMNGQMPGPVRQVALQAAEGSRIVMARILELQGTRDVDSILPELQGGVSEQQQQLNNLAAVIQSALGGSAGGAAGPVPPSGMGAPPQLSLPGQVPAGGTGAPAGFGAPNPVQYPGQGAGLGGVAGPAQQPARTLF